MQALPCSRLETAAVAFSHEKGSPGHESSPDGGLQAAPGLWWSCLGEASADFRFPANRFLAFLIILSISQKLWFISIPLSS